MMLEKDGENMMVENGKLSDTARKMMAGILDLSKSLTAFGNTIPTSYLRLVPHQEGSYKYLLGRPEQISINQGAAWMERSYRYDKGCQPG